MILGRQMMLRIGNGIVFRIFFADRNVVISVIVIPGCDTFIHPLFFHVAFFEVYFVLLRQYTFFWVFEINIFNFYFVFHVLRWNILSHILLLLRFNDSIVKDFNLFVLILLLITCCARNLYFIWDLALNRVKVEMNLFFFNLWIWKYRKSLRRCNSWLILLIEDNRIIHCWVEHEGNLS